jgi:cell wall assembly regulator SMI1
MDPSDGSATTVGRVSAAADVDPVEPVRMAFADASPKRIREALTAEDRAEFDRQWRDLMARATERLDLTEVQEALESWRQVAWVTSAHGPAIYERALASAQERLQTGQRASGALPWAQLKAELGLPE